MPSFQELSTWWGTLPQPGLCTLLLVWSWPNQSQQLWRDGCLPGGSFELRDPYKRTWNSVSIRKLNQWGISSPALETYCCRFFPFSFLHKFCKIFNIWRCSFWAVHSFSQLQGAGVPAGNYFLCRNTELVGQVLQLHNLSMNTGMKCDIANANSEVMIYFKAQHLLIFETVFQTFYRQINFKFLWITCCITRLSVPILCSFRIRKLLKQGKQG